ncbi:cell wall-binding repeat-containing protein [Halobacillus litoralis]|uniref:cell wall-binding repeat-containing protein n=1 Tax=Halobacillus litoralis TaxID=45668 RepID=UPI001CFD3D92|nr:cell wall-binding repeat-containing protein [Halobacillus litoralis]
MNQKKVGKKKIRLFAILSLVMMLVFPSIVSAAQTDHGVEEWSYVALGDSLAYGIQYDNTAGVSYADYIADDLENIYRLGSFTKEFAVPGLTSEGLLTQLQTNPDAQLAVTQADLITVSVGANDFLEVFKNDPEKLKNPEVVKDLLEQAGDNYKGILGNIRALNPDAKIFVMGYYNPFYAYPAEQQAELTPLMKALNQVIQAVSSGTGSGYVPTFDAISEDYPTYLPNPENVHPGPEGYQRISEEFWHAIKSVIPASSERLSGQDRYETAVQISEHGWGEAETVFIARGDDFPDALAGAPLAYKMDAPILLTEDTLSQSVKDELVRLKAKKAVILGGANAVTTDVEKELKGMGLDVERIGGKDRFATAANIAAYLNGDSDQAVIANGMNFPDALSIASYAAERGYPILLTKQNTLPDVTKTALSSLQSSIVIGGSAVVSETVFDMLPDAARYGGEDRYETSAQVATILNPQDKAFIATGANFADALTGSVLAAKTNSTFLLVPPTSLDDSIADAAEVLGVRHFTILGGPGAVNQSVTEELLQEIQ